MSLTLALSLTRQFFGLKDPLQSVSPVVIGRGDTKVHLVYVQAVGLGRATRKPSWTYQRLTLGPTYASPVPSP